MIPALLVFASSLLILGFVSIGLLRTAFVVVTVQGQSMFPTLEEYDRVLVWRFWPARWLQRGQIVIVRQLGKRAEGHLPFIKRIVGLPGDTIITSIDDLPGHLRLSLLAEHDTQGRRIWHIPPGYIFVRGDNRIGSVDSLSWGPIPFTRVGGIVLRKLSYKDVPREPKTFHVSSRKPQLDPPVPHVEMVPHTHTSVWLEEKAGK